MTSFDSKFCQEGLLVSNVVLGAICSQGKVEESIKYLEMFVEVAERSKNDKAISRACSDLGAMFNSLVCTDLRRQLKLPLYVFLLPLDYLH